MSNWLERCSKCPAEYFNKNRSRVERRGEAIGRPDRTGIESLYRCGIALLRASDGRTGGNTRRLSGRRANAALRLYRPDFPVRKIFRLGVFFRAAADGARTVDQAA